MQTISKLDAARRQLNTAIRLWLQEDDLASVQTLGWAALTILRDLTKAAGRPTPGGIPPEWQLDREAANFLKHADRDPGAWLLDIDPIIPEFVFNEAVALYAGLGQALTPEMDTARFLVRMKYGLDQDYQEFSERKREEERELERRLDDLDGEEREEAEADLKRQKRSWHSALMAMGRNKLTGDPLFRPDGSDWQRTGA